MEMLFRSNFAAIVGGGKVPRYPPNKVIIWDDEKKTILTELSFSSEVRAVRLRRESIVVALEYSVKVYSFSQSPILLQSINTSPNPLGLCALCPSSENSLLAIPSIKVGHVQIINITDMSQPSLEIAAHETTIACLALNLQGTVIATASERGTLIRTFDAKTGSMQHELRRGSNQAVIYSINFNHDSSLLCVASDRGTVHLFSLREAQQNKHSSLASASFLSKYFSSSWSFAKFQVVSPSQFICAFSNLNSSDVESVIVLTSDGSYYKFNLLPDQQCQRVSYTQFLEMTDDKW